jgi:hypothetical protein
MKLFASAVGAALTAPQPFPCTCTHSAGIAPAVKEEGYCGWLRVVVSFGNVDPIITDSRLIRERVLAIRRGGFATSRGGIRSREDQKAGTERSFPHRNINICLLCALVLKLSFVWEEPRTMRLLGLLAAELDSAGGIFKYSVLHTHVAHAHMHPTPPPYKQTVVLTADR